MSSNKVMDQEREAAEEAVGWGLTAEDVEARLETYAGERTEDLRNRLDSAVEIFDANGHRGIELADEIDGLRIVIAVRDVREAP